VKFTEVLIANFSRRLPFTFHTLRNSRANRFVSRARFVAILVLLNESFVALAVRAQTPGPTSVIPGIATGITPYGTYDGTQESVELTNGNLHVQIPLLKLAERPSNSLTLGLNTTVNCPI
jgi:hypothetical protein